VSRVLPVLIALVLTVWAVVDCVQTPSTEARILPKPLWLVCIILVPFVGAGAWLILGRARAVGIGRGGAPGGPAGGTAKRPRPQPIAPDDDPDFLRSLDTGNAEHERLLRRWEEDLKRREGDLRDDGSSGTEAPGAETDPRRDDERRRDDDPPAGEPAV
jgi:Phospholipase_D-nuclease N-terminal